MHASRPTILFAALLLAAGCGDDSPRATVCGDGVVSGSEECDDRNTADGDGCDACRFGCVSSDPGRDCTPADECAGQGTCDDETHVCAPGTPLPDEEPCAGGENNYCLAGVCTAPVCGNGQIEPGEECDGAEGCDECRLCADGTSAGCPQPVCGNGMREGGEQCDDGGTINLDGCDSACQFEQAARIVSLQQQFATDAFCPDNALGAAITPDAQPVIQATWDQPVADGTLSIVFKFLDLTDLSGQASTFDLGFVNARPAGRTFSDSPMCGNGVCEEGAAAGSAETAANCPDDCTYNGNDDLDWWYVRDASSVDETETPLVRLSGQITSGSLTAGPGTISLSLLFALEPAQVTLFNAVIEGTLDGPVDAPTISTTGAPPGHLESENLSPTLTSFASSSTGSMCSDVSVASLYDAPMPALLQFVCTDAAGENPVFTPANRLVDAFVAGCLVFGQPGITPTQPDGSTDGAAYRFALDASSTVSSCTRDGAPADLADCVAAATYSSYFKFSTDRVIIKRD